MTPVLALLVALAGGCGAVCRYALDHAVTQRVSGAMPWGTWLVNVTGSLALGLLVGLGLHADVSAELKLVIGGGFLGAYTTFSTWIYESLRLMEAGAWLAAGLNLLGSVVAGGVAVGVGLGVAWWLV